MIEFMTEENVREVLLPAIKVDEKLISVGKAINYRWGISYYVGITDKSTILLRSRFFSSKFKTLPNETANDYFEKKSIKLCPFEHPYILEEKGLRTYHQLKQMVMSLIESDEELITCARAEDRKHFFHDYCLAFTDRRLMIIEIDRKYFKVNEVESILLSEIRESTLRNSFKEIKMETPFEGNNNLSLKIKLSDGRKKTFQILSIAGSPAGLAGG